jgi:spore cortex formation protein SpoVR/YcgB (stage V sporulation)
MLDAYSSTGMPLLYKHWSFGKQFLVNEMMYRKGMRGLAYELVINSNPCINYIMEENSATMQTLVIAHAAFGHNHFFKNNYLFRQWTDAGGILDYLEFAKSYISSCEERYGQAQVERLLDAAHALMHQGVHRYPRAQVRDLKAEAQREAERHAHQEKIYNDLWRTLPRGKAKVATAADDRRQQLNLPQENILYFLEKSAPRLEPWQREILRIVRKVSQYFYPQKQTQVMNEGWATFWHYTILNHLYDEGKVSERFMMEFLHSHTNVVFQPAYNSPWYSGINPYALGFAMFQDIKRICQSPTEEDKYWFPDIAGSDWLETLHFAMRDFKDESFISQFMSPKIMRDFRFFTVLDDDRNNYLEISAIHNEEGYREIRSRLSSQYNLSNLEPNIQVWNVDLRGDRSLTLRYIPHNRAPLDKGRKEVLKHVHRLWGFDVLLEQQNEDGSVELLERCPARLNTL